VKVKGSLHLLAPHETLCAYSVNLPAVSVWHVWVLTDTMDYQCIIVYTIITILPPNRPGLAADTQWEPQGTAARACCFAWIKCCIKRCAFHVLWVHSSLPWKFGSSCNVNCAVYTLNIFCVTSWSEVYSNEILTVFV